MKIIKGAFRGYPIPAANLKKTRPTSSLVREAYFDIVAPWIDRCSFFDLFSGTGAMGLEALSRGACEIVFCEKDRKLAFNIRDTFKQLAEDFDEAKNIAPPQILSYDWRRAVKTLDKKNHRFPLIYSDPPYSFYSDASFLKTLVESCLKLLKSRGLMTIEISSERAHFYLKGEYFPRLLDRLAQTSSLAESPKRYFAWGKKYGSTYLFFFGDDRDSLDKKLLIS